MGEIVVTGSSGFIGSHLVAHLSQNVDAGTRIQGFDRVLPDASPTPILLQGDLGRKDDLSKLAGSGIDHLFHLAAEAEVEIPFSALQRFVDSNISGTLNLLAAADPATLFFASSSAVYGHRDAGATSTDWAGVNPVGFYGMSKAIAEMACRNWAIEKRRAAISFRFGNVIGPRCRGLIPFLVEHAIRYPDGIVPARCRGGGEIVRDYLPVGYLVRILDRARTMDWKSGEHAAFNVGTGRGRTNGAVGRIVQDRVGREGMKLAIDWDHPMLVGESRAVILDNGETERTFELPTPGEDDIAQAIEEAVQYFLGRPR